MDFLVVCLFLSSLIEITEHQDIWEPRPVSAHPWHPTGGTSLPENVGQVWSPEIYYPRSEDRRRPILREFLPSTIPATTTTITTTTMRTTTSTTTTTTTPSTTTTTTTEAPTTTTTEPPTTTTPEPPTTITAKSTTTPVPTTTTQAPTTPKLISKSCQPFTWSDTHKSKLRKGLISKINEVAKETCGTFTQANCPFHKAVRKIRQCLKRYAQFAQAAEEDDEFVPKKDPIPKPPTVLTILEDPQLGFMEMYEKIPIRVSFEIEDITDLSDFEQNFRLDYTILMSWQAEPKACLKLTKQLCAQDLDYVTGPVKLKPLYFDLFWIPDLYIFNAILDSKISQNVDMQFLKVNGVNGTMACTLEYAVKSFAIVDCPMEFPLYPVDIQQCPVKIRSFRYPSKNLGLKWMEPIGVTAGKIVLAEQKFNYTTRIESITILEEPFDVLTIDVTFSRLIANKIAGVYIPTLIQVLTTFLTFWMGLYSTSERVTIGITCLLGLVTYFTDVRSRLPQSSNVSLMDVWMLVCIIFVTLQMIEATFITFIFDKHKNIWLHRFDHREKVEEGDCDREDLSTGDRRKHRVDHFVTTLGLNEEGQVKKSKLTYFTKVKLYLFGPEKTPQEDPKVTPYRIDTTSKILFPLTFFLFNLFYWPFVLNENKVE